MAQTYLSPQGRELAYVQTAGKGPGVVFLGGFKSDMQGSKAQHMQAWAEASGRSFLRFDYSGHGTSGGRFEDGSIGDWAEDAYALISALTEGPQVLVGSSMGGWISLLLSKRLGARMAGLVGIAAAPDFTEDSMWAAMPDEIRAELMAKGLVSIPSAYPDFNYVITRRLIEDGRQHLVLRAPLDLPFPTRFLQGTADVDVSQETALRLLAHARGEDIRLTLVKGADHRFSTPECLELVTTAVEEILAAL